MSTYKVVCEWPEGTTEETFDDPALWVESFNEAMATGARPRAYRDGEEFTDQLAGR